jgi:hypothetical protein
MNVLVKRDACLRAEGKPFPAPSLDIWQDKPNNFEAMNQISNTLFHTARKNLLHIN